MFLLLFICVIASSQAQEIRVETQQGWIVGRRNVDHIVFYGIPYAGDTSKGNRFKAPTPVPKHTADFQAVNKNVTCVQPSPTGMIVGVEDCLVLNIHTEQVTSKRPVFVWLDGEDYRTTTKAPYSFKAYLKDMVVVTINYRLSIFGFLCLRVPEAPGNAGLKDVIQGLQWIRDNIAGFGGDPNNIMLVGHGSAAAMVDLITLSPLSNNLVHKAVVLSGSALAPWAVSYNPIDSAQYVGDKLKYTNKTNSQLAKLLADTDLNAFKDVLLDETFYNASLRFAPCIEDDNLNPGKAILTNAPINTLRTGNYNDIPYLTGYTNREGTLRLHQAENDEWMKKMQDNFTAFLPVDLSFNDEKNKIIISNYIRDQYFGSDIISMEHLDKYIKYHGDVLAILPITRAAEERVATSNESVRLFEFAYIGTSNSDWRYTVNSSQINGSRHGDLPKYIFDYDLGEEDANATESMAYLLKLFATKPESMTLQGGKKWLPIEESAFNKLLISSVKTVVDSIVYFENIIQQKDVTVIYWQRILQNYYKPPTAPITGPSKDKNNSSKLSQVNCLTLFIMLMYVLAG